MPLIVIHSNDKIEIPALGAIKQGVRRERTFNIPATGAAGYKGGHNLLFLLAMPKQPVLSRMGIDAAHSNTRVYYPRLSKSLVTALNRPLHQPRLNPRDGVDKADMSGHMQHLHLRGAEHQRYFRSSR